MKQTILKHKLLTAGFTAFLSFFILSTAQTHAATFSVAAGNDENTDNGSCSLSEAIQNINDQAATNTDCPAGDGSNDTITLPTGTITLTGNLAQIDEDTIIQGQGMGESIIDGDGQYSGIISASTNFTANGFTLTGALDFGIRVSNNVDVGNIEIDGDNWAITDPSGTAGGILIVSDTNTDTIVTATNIYIHDFDVNVSQFFSLGIAGGNTDDVTADASNVTISTIANTGMNYGIATTAGLFDAGTSLGAIDATIHNSTLDNIYSSGGIVVGFMLAGATQDTISNSLILNNNTVTNLNADGTSPFIGELANGSVIAIVGGSVNSIDNTLTSTNLLTAGNGMETCTTGNVNSAFSMSGTVTSTIASGGGNLTDDTSCSSYFTEPSDQNNLTNLSNTLAPLTNNGGLIPTIALLEGSSAIDSGVAVAGLTTDARGEARPQGLTYDSGAYESPFTQLAAASPNQDSLADTGTNPVPFILMALSAISASIFLVQKRSSND